MHYFYDVEDLEDPMAVGNSATANQVVQTWCRVPAVAAHTDLWSTLMAAATEMASVERVEVLECTGMMGAPSKSITLYIICYREPQNDAILLRVFLAMLVKNFKDIRPTKEQS